MKSFLQVDPFRTRIFHYHDFIKTGSNKKISLMAVALWISACSISTKKTILSPSASNIYKPEKNKTIALLGTTGMAGGYILHDALIEGYNIRALARTPAKLDALKSQIAIIKGNARDISSIRKLLKGVTLL